MPSLLLKLIALLLLVAQAWLGFARGETMCIKWGSCEHHETPVTCHHADGEHEHVHSHAEVNIRCADLAAFENHHQHGLLATIDLQQPACGCHLHIPSPSDRPAQPSTRAQIPQPRDLFVPLVVAILSWGHVPQALPRPASIPDDQPGTASRTLLTTRLLL